MKKLKVWASEQGATSLSKVNGPNGAFISMTFADGSKKTIPCGKRSQNGTLDTYNVLETDDKNFIATVNEYKVAETIALTSVAKETV